ncbi:helix-turn-helix domain-containing protein [Sulfobacillus harzensis]|uniref:Helix-turn-helix transcriptional regulator n=1 Tax=Sulfobacillus harzensis TaxID=2729629 RepID=A0A7Y0Q4Q8_9FIRM|nr:helix-turn-helix transcriptional regulator [Sulfobacillus harzensis]NMP24665.1 helix-turn-helix transcriptional regulator [Sulfobacillus harzensis]
MHTSRSRVRVDIITVGKRLSYWRKLQGWTPVELAELTCHAQRSFGIACRPVTAAWIRMVERGAYGRLSSLSQTRLWALALALDIPVEFLAPQAHQSSSATAAWDANSLSSIITRYILNLSVWYQKSQGKEP